MPELKWILEDARLDGPELATRIGLSLPAMTLLAHERDELQSWGWAANVSPDQHGIEGGGRRPGGRWRLGRHVEQVLHAWLQQSCHFSMLAANWPLRDAGRTIGEADLLLKRRCQGDSDAAFSFEHWEVAFKIFIEVCPGHFVGPGLQDTLKTKCEHMARRQLALCDHPAFDAAWGQPGPSGWARHTVLSGWLFSALGYAAIGQTGGDSGCAVPSHGWCLDNDGGLEHAAAIGDTLGVVEWKLLDRPDWITPTRATPTGVTSPRAQLRALVAGCGRLPVLVAAMGASRLSVDRDAAADSFAAPEAHGIRLAGGPLSLEERFRLAVVDQRWLDAASSL